MPVKPALAAAPSRLPSVNRARVLALGMSLAALVIGVQQRLDVRYNPFRAPGYFELRPEDAVATYASRRFTSFTMGELHLTSSHSLPRQVFDKKARLFAAVEISAPDTRGNHRDYCVVVSAPGWVVPQAHLAHTQDWTVVELTLARCERRRTGIQSGA
jgi:hypothetical protein